MESLSAGISPERERQAHDRLLAALGSIGRESVLSQPKAYCGVVDLAPALQWNKNNPVLVVVSGLETFNDPHSAEQIAQQLLTSAVSGLGRRGVHPIAVVNKIIAHTLDPEVVAAIAAGFKIPLVNQRWLDSRTPLLGGAPAECPALLQPERWIVSVAAIGIANRETLERNHRTIDASQPFQVAGEDYVWRTFADASPIQYIRLDRSIAGMTSPTLEVTVDFGTVGLFKQTGRASLETLAMLPTLIHTGLNTETAALCEESVTRWVATWPSTVVSLPLHHQKWPDVVYGATHSGEPAHFLEAMMLGVVDKPKDHTC